MFHMSYSGGLLGIEGYLVQVEADVGDGLPGFQMVGHLASETREAQDRVRTGIKNSGIRLSPKKVTVNLSPANVKKEGTGYDLAVAAAVLASYGVIRPGLLSSSAFVGELGLDGSVKPVRGILPMALAMRDAKLRWLFLGEENVCEGAVVEGLGIVPVRTLSEMVEYLNHPEALQARKWERKWEDGGKTGDRVDFKDVNGQRLLLRATEVGVAGMHNLLYIGPPGSGKSMIARRIPTIMPRLSREEQLEVSKVYSICGMLTPGSPLVKERPFRAPHHTASASSLAGGGLRPRPGEISLASRGVLFLDELPEFQKRTLEILRQPMEEGEVTVSRAQGSLRFPAHFMLAAAMNSCPCGYYPNRDRCSCTSSQIRQYLSRVSRPLLDRIDICAEAAPVTYHELSRKSENESSDSIRERVEQARQIQKKRFEGRPIYFNSEMGKQELDNFCVLGGEQQDFLKRIYKSLRLSARGYHKILRVSRTIADLEGAAHIQSSHLAEAVGYRELEERYWGGIT